MNTKPDHTSKMILVAVIFLLLATLPENLSRSALPHQQEYISPKDESELFRLTMLQEIDQIDAIIQSLPYFNGNIMVVKNHHVIYQKSQGYANWETQQPLTIQSSFELASVSKQFTALAVLMLYERQQLDLDDPLKLYIPELLFSNVTIRQALQHTGGLPNYMWLLEHSWNLEHLPSNNEMISLLVAERFPLLFEPGRRHSYSNTGYALLASVVERVSGKSFSQFLRENIFETLDMRQTFTSVEMLDSIHSTGNLASGHRRFWRCFRPNTPAIHDRVLGDKGIHSSLEDLYKWDQALYTEKLVSKKTLEIAYEPLLINKRFRIPYGLGFRLGNKNEERFVYHHGLWEGFRTALMRYIERGDAIIILNNANQHFNNLIISQIESILEQEPEPTPSYELFLTLIRDGWQAAEELLAAYEKNGCKSLITNDEIIATTSLLRDLGKPALSSLVYNFCEKHELLAESELTHTYIE